MHRPDEPLSYAVQYEQIFHPSESLCTPKSSQESEMNSANSSQAFLGAIDPEIHLEPPSFKYEAWNACFDGPQVEYNSSISARETQRFPFSENPESRNPAPLNFVFAESTMAHPRPTLRHSRPEISTFEEREHGLSPISSPFEPESKSSNEFMEPPKKVPLHIHLGSSDAVTIPRSTNPIVPSSEGKSAKIPYAKLIYRALCGAKGHRMTLREIYKWFEEHTDKAKDPHDKGWQNSVRHNLSMNGDFLKKPHPDLRERTKNSFIWVLAPTALERGIESTTRYRCKRDDPYRVKKNSHHHSHRQRKHPNSKPNSRLLSPAQPVPALRNSILTLERSGTPHSSLPSNQSVIPTTSSGHHKQQRPTAHGFHYFANQTHSPPYSMTRHFEPVFTNFPEFAGFESQNFLLARV